MGIYKLRLYIGFYIPSTLYFYYLRSDFMKYIGLYVVGCFALVGFVYTVKEVNKYVGIDRTNASSIN